MDKFLTVNEIATVLKVKRGTVIRWIRAGKLKAFKPGDGRFWRVSQRDLKKILR